MKGQLRVPVGACLLGESRSLHVLGMLRSWSPRAGMLGDSSGELGHLMSGQLPEK